MDRSHQATVQGDAASIPKRSPKTMGKRKSSDIEVSVDKHVNWTEFSQAPVQAGELFIPNPSATVDIKWVPLTHKGHVSDYHGIQRRHDSFLPLKFGLSIPILIESIEETLSKFPKIEEGVHIRPSQHLSLAGRSTKQRRDVSTSPDLPDGVSVDDLQSLPIRFGATSEGEPPEQDKGQGFQITHDIAQPLFRQWDLDPFDFGEPDASDDAPKKRVSRSAKLAVQKEASRFLLSELAHKFRFILEYNSGFPKKYTVQEAAEPATPELRISDLEETNGGSKRKRRNFGMKTAYNFKPIRHQTVEEVAALVQAVQLDSQQLIQDFEELRRQANYPVPTVPLYSFPRAISDYIASLHYETSGEDIEEDRVMWIRATRSYKSKADQEAIEKKTHEEERKLKAREYAYLSRGRTKQSPQVLEYEHSQYRPIVFENEDSASRDIGPDEHCPYDPECGFCKNHYEPKTHVSLKSQSAILNPDFKRLPQDYFKYDDEVAMESNGEPTEPTGRGSRIRNKSINQEYARCKLEEMKHEIAFVSEYNSGLLGSR